MKSCKKCGQDNLDDAKFCSNCGEKFSNNTEIGDQKDLTDSKIERTNLSDDISESDVQKKVSNDEKEGSKTSTFEFTKVPPIKENNEIKSKFKKLDFKNKKNRNIIIGVFAVVVILFIAIATSGTPVESIKLEYSDATLDLGTTGVLDVKITPDDATNKKNYVDFF